MPLTDGYGVLVGTIHNYFRDPPDHFGRYYHGNLEINTPAGLYRAAIDVDSKQSGTGVEWRIVPLGANELAAFVGLAAGFHALASNDASGALDYIRSPMFALRIGCIGAIWKLLGKTFSIAQAWKQGTDVQALADLEPLVTATRNAGLKVFVFGEPFRQGRGVHNIHQNQGDPLTSQWAAENGIWQDGCTILQQSATEFSAFMNKFTSQAYETDIAGHPI